MLKSYVFGARKQEINRIKNAWKYMRLKLNGLLLFQMNFLNFPEHLKLHFKFCFIKQTFSLIYDLTSDTFKRYQTSNFRCSKVSSREFYIEADDGKLLGKQLGWAFIWLNCGWTLVLFWRKNVKKKWQNWWTFDNYCCLVMLDCTVEKWFRNQK